MLRAETNKYAYLFLILNLVPVISFFLYIRQYAVNVPFMDDMEFVDTINELHKNLARLPSLLFRQQNDHRSAVPRLGVLMTYWTSGTLDFRFAVLSGYLNLMLLGWSFFLVYKSSHKGYLGFLPVTLLLFSAIVYQDHLWTITAYQHTLSIAFSILALFFIQRNKIKYWYYAIPFSIAATLTNLDGISLLAVIMVWLSTQKRWKHLFVYFLFASLYLLLYFSDFKFSPASKLPSSIDGIYLAALSFVALTGSIAKVISDTYDVTLSIIIGGTVLFTYLFLKIIPFLSASQFPESRKHFFNFSFAEMCFLKLLTSIAIIAVGRSADGIDGMMAIRFQIYSASLIITFYLFVIEKIDGKILTITRYFSLLLAIALNSMSYVKYDAAVKYFSSSLKADAYNYPAKGIFLHQYFNLPDPEPKFYRNYVFPIFFDRETIANWKSGNGTHTGAIDLKVIGKENKGAYSHYLNPLLEFVVETDKFKSLKSEAYLCIFQNDELSTPYIVALMEDKGSLYQRLISNKLPTRWYGDIPDKIPAGTYQANLCWIENGDPKSIILSNTISL